MYVFFDRKDRGFVQGFVEVSGFDLLLVCFWFGEWYLKIKQVMDIYFELSMVGLYGYLIFGLNFFGFVCLGGWQ